MFYTQTLRKLNCSLRNLLWSASGHKYDFFSSHSLRSRTFSASSAPRFTTFLYHTCCLTHLTPRYSNPQVFPRQPLRQHTNVFVLRIHIRCEPRYWIWKSAWFSFLCEPRVWLSFGSIYFKAIKHRCLCATDLLSNYDAIEPVSQNVRGAKSGAVSDAMRY